MKKEWVIFEGSGSAAKTVDEMARRDSRDRRNLRICDECHSIRCVSATEALASKFPFRLGGFCKTPWHHDGAPIAPRQRKSTL
jgi:hypothetical protein